MSPRAKKVLAVTATVVLWIFVPASLVFFLGAGFIWLLHGAMARVLRVRGIKTFRARYESAAFESPKPRRLALRIVPPAGLFLVASLFWAMALTQAQTHTSEVLVDSGFPAEQAGVRSGDRIVSVDGTPVSTFAEVSDRVRAAPSAAPLLLEVQRGDARHQLTVHRNEEGRLGIRPASTASVNTTGSALRNALVVTASSPWRLARVLFSDALPENVMVGVSDLQQRGGPLNGTARVAAGIGATLSAIWLPFLVLGLALFQLGERTAPPKGSLR